MDLPPELTNLILEYLPPTEAGQAASGFGIDGDYLMVVAQTLEVDLRQVLFALKVRAETQAGLMGTVGGAILSLASFHHRLDIDYNYGLAGEYTLSVEGGDAGKIAEELGGVHIEDYGDYAEFIHRAPSLVRQAEILYKCSRPFLQSLEDDLIAPSYPYQTFTYRSPLIPQRLGCSEELALGEIAAYNRTDPLATLAILVSVARIRRDALQPLKETQAWKLYQLADPSLVVEQERDQARIRTRYKADVATLFPVILDDPLVVEAPSLVYQLTLIDHLSRSLAQTLLDDTVSYLTSLSFHNGRLSPSD
jgi:hypothetical protein